MYYDAAQKKRKRKRNKKAQIDVIWVQARFIISTYAVEQDLTLGIGCAGDFLFSKIQYFPKVENFMFLKNL